MVRIAPSILSADFTKLGEDLKELEKNNIEVLHIDVMDGNFVPNISFGFPIIKAVRPITKMVFDVHLMIENPSNFIKEFVDAGADIITIHYETDRHIDRTINYIKSFGIKAGIALNPATPVNTIKHLIGNLDLVLIMSVNPGFGGQSYIEYCSEKIKELRDYSNKSNPDLIIEVDGGIKSHNIKEVVNCGANLIVAGSAVFKNGAMRENIDELKRALR
ncbi:ribulose-phosphate 3-epimerase [Clostridium sp. DL1XJH146]